MEDEDLTFLAGELSVFHQDFAPAFQDRRIQNYSQIYSLGLFSDLGRKSIEPIALELGGRDMSGISSASSRTTRGTRRA